jgi:hypothetical protein
MRRSTVDKVLLALVAGLALLAFSCDDDDDGVGGATTGDVSVQMSMAQPPAAPPIAQSEDAQIFVHFTYLALTNDGEADEVLIEGAGADPVDITQDDVIGPFNVTPGTYAGFTFAIDDVYVIDGPQGDRRCDDTDLDPELPIEQEPTEFEGDFLEVEEDGTHSLLVTMPVFGAACEQDGGEAVIDILAPPNDYARASVMN